MLEPICETERVLVPKGALIVATLGDHHSFDLVGIYYVRADFDAYALRDEWLQDHPESALYWRINEDAFLHWVSEKGLIEPLDSLEWHLGPGYGQLGEMAFSVWPGGEAEIVGAGDTGDTGDTNEPS